MKRPELLVVVFLVFAGREGFGRSHPEPACRYPPSQWCHSLQIAVECKVSVNYDQIKH